MLSSPDQAHLMLLCPVGQYPTSPGGPMSASRKLPSFQGWRVVFRRGIKQTESRWKVTAGRHGSFSGLWSHRWERTPLLAPLRGCVSCPAPRSRLPRVPQPHDTPRALGGLGPPSSAGAAGLPRGRGVAGRILGHLCLGVLMCGRTPGAGNPKFTLSCEARPAFYYHLLTSAGYGTNYFGGPSSRDEEPPCSGEAFLARRQREPPWGARPDNEGAVADLSSGLSWACVPAEQGALHPSSVIFPMLFGFLWKVPSFSVHAGPSVFS